MPGRATQQRTFSLIPVLILTALLAIGCAGFYWMFLRPQPLKPLPQLTPDAKAYVRNLALSDTEMKATENYMGATVVELTGKITNNGQRRLRLVELNCVFTDPYGQVLLRERVPIVRDKGASLAPGEARNFRLPFDSIPQSWNQAMPQLVIARIDFEE